MSSYEQRCAMISKCLHKALVENWAMGQNWANLGKFLGKLGQIFGQNWANWAKLGNDF